jgi:hypothetical protein
MILKRRIREAKTSQKNIIHKIPNINIAGLVDDAVINRYILTALFGRIGSKFSREGGAMKKCIHILTLTALLGCTAATAQDIKIERVETTEPGTPLYQNEEGTDTIQARGILQTSSSTKKWFRIAAEYSTQAEWTDRLTLEYYVLFPEGTHVFKGVINYVDIPKGREHLSEMYMHFNSYARHSKRGVIQYAVIALADGKQVSVDTNKKTPENWWKKLPVHPCGLLDRNMTPFVVFNVEKFGAQDHCSWQ